MSDKLSKPSAAWSDSCMRLSTQSSQTLPLLDLHISASWIVFMTGTLATCRIDMVGLISCLIELTKQLCEMIDLFIRTWFSWLHVDCATRVSCEVSVQVWGLTLHILVMRMRPCLPCISDVFILFLLLFSSTPFYLCDLIFRMSSSHILMYK